MNIYTDGAYSTLRNQGGWAFYCPKLNLKVTNSVKNTTNNRMELTAVLAALQYILLSKLSNIKITIISDSMYVIGCASLGWGRKENNDLWNIYEIYKFRLNELQNQIIFKHVKGHTDCIENNIVDLLANTSSNI